MLEKKHFVNAIRLIKEIEIEDEQLTKLVKRLCYDVGMEDFNCICTGKAELIGRVLREAMNDKEGWIDWWLYDTNFGTKNPEVELYGEKLLLDTPERLYDVLIMEYSRKES